jgi:hypothetical protein
MYANKKMKPEPHYVYVLHLPYIYNCEALTFQVLPSYIHIIQRKEVHHSFKALFLTTVINLSTLATEGLKTVGNHQLLETSDARKNVEQ